MLAQQAALFVIRVLRQHGYQAFLAGGCVRDLLLGREPADYDVATSATPQQVMSVFPRTWAVGAQFGVVLVPVDSLQPCPPIAPTSATQMWGARKKTMEEDDVSSTLESQPAGVIEVATFRSDVGYSDGRHPDQVRFTNSPREDVCRRDFTINGLLLDSAEEGRESHGHFPGARILELPSAALPVRGRVLDFVGGAPDLQAGVIRTIGEPWQRFREDKLRLLRAVRFAARFDYRIDAQTFAAIRELAPEIHVVSRERVRDELTKMLTEGRARRAFELLEDTGLLHQVLPEVEKMKGVEQPPQFHPEGDVWVHTRMILASLPGPKPRRSDAPGEPAHPGSRTLAWGALLHDVGKPSTFRVAPDRIRFDGHVEVGEAIAREICRRLRMSNDDTEQIVSLVANHMRFADVPRMKLSTLKRFLRLPQFGEHLELHRMDCLASHGDLSIYERTRAMLETVPEEQFRPPLLINGRDLIALGMSPGPAFKEILAAVEDAQLEGQIQSKQQALDFVRQLTLSNPELSR